MPSTSWGDPPKYSREKPPAGYTRRGGVWYKTDNSVSGPSKYTENAYTGELQSADWASPQYRPNASADSVVSQGLNAWNSAIQSGLGAVRFRVQQAIPGENATEKSVKQQLAQGVPSREAYKNAWVNTAPDYGVNTPIGRIGMRGVAELAADPTNFIPGAGFVKLGGTAVAKDIAKGISKAGTQAAKTTGKRVGELAVSNAGELDVSKLAGKATKPVDKGVAVTKAQSHGVRLVDGILRLDAEKVPDVRYRSLMGTAAKQSLRKGETWRSRALYTAQYDFQQHAITDLDDAQIQRIKSVLPDFTSDTVGTVTKPVTEAAEQVASSPVGAKVPAATTPLEAAQPLIKPPASMPFNKVADAAPPVQPPKPPAATSAGGLSDSGKLIGEFIVAPSTAKREAVLQLAIHAQKAQKSAIYTRLYEEYAKVMPLTEAAEKAKSALAGSMPVTQSDALIKVVREDAYRDIYNKLISSGRSYDIVSTNTALDKLLSTGRISMKVTEKGKTEYQLLTNVFGADWVKKLNTGTALKDQLDKQLLASLPDPTPRPWTDPLGKGPSNAVPQQPDMFPSTASGKYDALENGQLSFGQGAEQIPMGKSDFPPIQRTPQTATSAADSANSHLRLMIEDNLDEFATNPVVKQILNQQPLTEQNIVDVADKIILALSKDPATKVRSQEVIDALRKSTSLFDSKQPVLIAEKVGRGRQFINAVKKKSTWLSLINASKTLTTIFDISAPGRQGAMLAARKEWWQSWKPMIKATFDPEYAKQLMYDIKTNPDFAWSQTSKTSKKLFQGEFDSAKLSAKEESYIGNIINKVPGLGKISRASERAYVVFLNKLRWDVWHNEFLRMKQMGLSPQELAEHSENWADAVNKLTGRGNVGGLAKSDTTMSVLNSILFSPRFVVSRIQAPLTLVTKDAVVRKMIAKDLVKFYGSAASILGLATVAGAAIELDPRSSDFGKMRVGNTRYDILGGNQQIMRYMVQIASGQKKSASGQIENVNRLDTLARGLQSKAAPSAGLITALLDGKTFVGDDITPGSQAFSMLTPLFIQDVIDAMKEEGIVKGGVMALPGAAGIGTQTYKPSYNAWMKQYPETVRLELPYGKVSDKIGIGNNGLQIKLSDKETSTLQSMTNSLAEKSVKDITSSQIYAQATDAQRKEVLSKLVNRARDQARATLLRMMSEEELQKRILEARAAQTRTLEQTNPAAAKKIIFQNPQILAYREQQALQALAAKA